MADNVKVWQDRRKIAQMITTVENALPGHEEILQDIYKKTGQAYIIGITGPPGAGKSSLTDALSRVYIDMGKRVGVIAIAVILACSTKIFCNHFCSAASCNAGHFNLNPEILDLYLHLTTAFTTSCAAG